MKNSQAGKSRDVQLARSLWGPLSRPTLIRLKELIERFGLSVARGELQYLYEGWYVTHAGLLGLAQRKHCVGIHVQEVREYLRTHCRSLGVQGHGVSSSRSSKGFVGYGDADPSNVSSMVRGAELRIAETRAVNRALRKAYGIGLCSVEELGAFSSAPRPSAVPSPSNGVSFLQRFGQRSTSAPRSALPFDPPVQPRCESREGLRSRLLRHANPQRRHP